MSDNIIDLSETASTSKTDKSASIVRKLKDTFDINTDLSGVIFSNSDVSEYCGDKNENHTFGEKTCLLYTTNFTAYNVEYSLKVLSFQYDKFSEVLKIETNPCNALLKKEMEGCCNYLKRRRNMNLLFKLLVAFSRAVECRRLVLDIILKKCRSVKIENNADGGVIITYTDMNLNVRLGIFWSIACNTQHEVDDVIEVYYNNFELNNKEEIKDMLVRLTHPQLDFRAKYHLWSKLLTGLSGRPERLHINPYACTSHLSIEKPYQMRNNPQFAPSYSTNLRNIQNLSIDMLLAIYPQLLRSNMAPNRPVFVNRRSLHSVNESSVQRYAFSRRQSCQMSKTEYRQSNSARCDVQFVETKVSQPSTDNSTDIDIEVVDPQKSTDQTKNDTEIIVVDCGANGSGQEPNVTEVPSDETTNGFEKSIPKKPEENARKRSSPNKTTESSSEADCVVVVSDNEEAIENDSSSNKKRKLDAGLEIVSVVYVVPD